MLDFLSRAASLAAAERRARWPDWTGQPVVVVASGPSAAACDLEPIRGRARVIVVNSSWRLAPWADVLYASDGPWWASCAPAPAEFTGLRATRSDDPVAGAQRVGMNIGLGLQPGQTGFVVRPAQIGWFDNSGAEAANLAIMLGSRRIALVGFDMHTRAGVHWHGEHGGDLRNPDDATLAAAAMALDSAAPSAAAAGVEIVNAAADSRLQAYRKMAWPDAAEWLLAG